MTKVTGASASLIVALLALFLGAVIELTLRRRSTRRPGPVALGATVVSSLALVLAWLLRSGDAAGGTYGAPGSATSFAFALRLDGLALPFVVNLMIVALFALWYAQDYMKHVDEPHWCYALILLFIGGMLGALVADDLLLLLILWESMLVFSSLLLLRWGQGPNVGAVTLRYFLYNQAGSLLLLAAVAWLATVSGSTRPDEITVYLLHHDMPGLSFVAAALLLGFGVKMAIAPLHGWLPDAHAIAPMPVTILLAGAMLSLGAYGMLRFVIGMLGAASIEPLRLTLMVLALGSQIYGALMSLASRDIKRIVAYSSISQMGYVLFGMTTLSQLGLTGSVLHVISHGVLKAFLFMAVGVVMSRTDRRQISMLGGLWQLTPRLMVALGLGALAMAGLPPMIAFHSEWRILAAGLASGYPVLGVLAFIAPVLTTCYALALVGRLAFAPAPDGMTVKAAPRSMVVSTTAALALAVVLGLLGGPLSRWVENLLAAVQGGLL